MAHGGVLQTIADAKYLYPQWEADYKFFMWVFIDITGGL